MSDSEDAPGRQPSRVQRPLAADVVDLGNLLLVESNDLGRVPEDEAGREARLSAVARDNAQELLNALFALTPKRVDDVLVAPLPPPEFRLPRAKPIPKPKPLTKWEKYAKEKGIEKKKKTKLVWDDVVKEWVPRYGYKKAKAEEAKNWMMEYKGDAKDTEDPFEKAREEKRERVSKNEFQRLRNIARSRKVKVPGVGLPPVQDPKTSRADSSELKRAADLAKSSTASLGKFQPGLSSSLEKQAKKGPAEGKKRKFEPLVSKGEKERNLKLFEQMNSKKPKLDLSKAVGATINSEERERAASKKQNSKGGKGGSKGKAKKAGGGGKRTSFGQKRRGGAGKKPGKAGGNRGRKK